MVNTVVVASRMTSADAAAVPSAVVAAMLAAVVPAVVAMFAVAALIATKHVVVAGTPADSTAAVAVVAFCYEGCYC